MIKHIFLILLVSLLSCGSQTKTEEVDFLNTEEFQEGGSDLISYSRTRNRDIVQHLYDQALELNPELKLLDSKISNIQEIRTDSLADYIEYKKYNQMYYESAGSYAHKIRDSTKRKRIIALLLDSKMADSRQMAAYEEQANLIGKLDNVLEDQLNLMKIVVSENMISAYQNKKPKIESLESTNQMYKDLISKSAKHTKSN